MGQIGGRAPMMLGVLWTFQAIAFALVGLRLYARLVVVQTYGWDDHFFNGAVILLLVYNMLMSAATTYGLGQSLDGEFTYENTRALLLVNIGQSIINFTAAIVKGSIALFLVRIVASSRTHKIMIVVPVVLMSIIITVAVVCLWFACTPIEYSWNTSLPGGHCNGDEEFIVALIGGLSIVVVEIFYASFPWYLVRKLQMPRREKILVGSCMSFGYLSAICSIYRLLTLLRLAYTPDDNYLYTITDLLIWHAADITTQLVSIGATVSRPLYKDWLNNVAIKIESAANSASRSRKGRSELGTGSEFSVIALQTIGGSSIAQKKSAKAAVPDNDIGTVTVERSWMVESNSRNGLFPGDADSEEHILNTTGVVQAESDEPGRSG